MTKALQHSDPDVLDVLRAEQVRQEEGLELIASENYVSQAVMDAQGSVLTNKYAEGYPAKRYYGGCEVVDRVESLAIDRVCKLFGVGGATIYANVQAHSGSQANMGAYLAVMKAGEKILGMSLAQGGHLTHGSPVNFSGRLFQVESYGLDPKTERIDYDQVRDHAKRFRPKVLVAGASAYSRVIDFEVFGQIAKEVEAHLIVDMAHIAGLVAAGLHPSPIPHSTYVTSTTHKTLRGPRGGLILCRTPEDLKAVNSQIFPGIQGGPLMHVIAAKAVSFGEALKPSFKTYQQAILDNSRALARGLTERGLRLVSGGTDNHLCLIDLTSFGDGSVTGKDGEAWMGLAGITVNKNTIPNEKRSPFVTSGIRVGTPAITSRGLKSGDMGAVAGWIVSALESRGDETKLSKIRAQVHDLCKRYPVYGPQGSLVALSR